MSIETYCNCGEDTDIHYDCKVWLCIECGEYGTAYESGCNCLE
jgi:hypothetical protein